jgi:hypothetical protein
MTADTQSLTLDRLQHDLLMPQIEAFLAAAPDDSARAPYLALRDAIDALEIPAELTARLGAIAEVLLTSGRVRHAYGPGAELSLWSLFQKTPRGREIATSIAALNTALKQLEGQPVEFIAAAARAPGAYALTIRTASCEMVLRFDASGARLETLEIATS